MCPRWSSRERLGWDPQQRSDQVGGHREGSRRGRWRPGPDRARDSELSTHSALGACQASSRPPSTRPLRGLSRAQPGQRGWAADPQSVSTPPTLFPRWGQHMADICGLPEGGPWRSVMGARAPCWCMETRVHLWVHRFLNRDPGQVPHLPELGFPSCEGKIVVPASGGVAEGGK